MPLCGVSACLLLVLQTGTLLGDHVVVGADNVLISVTFTKCAAAQINEVEAG